MTDEIIVRKNRWADLLQPEGSKRKFVYIINYPIENEPNSPLFWPDKKAERIEWAWKKYNLGLERIQWLQDDFIPFMTVTSGTEIFAEALGCKVHRPLNNMPCAIPYVYSASEAVKVQVPKLEDSTLMHLFDIADELKKRGGKDALMNMPDLQSPMDIVAQIWNKSDLFVSMIEEPEAVKELAHKAKLLLQAFLDEWFKRYGKEFIAHHPDYYMPQGITLSVDEVGSVNPHMFVEFFLDELNELSDRYGGIGIHCCANSVHQWANFASVRNLRLLNFYRPNETIEKAYEYFAKISAQWHGMLVNGVPEPLVNKNSDEYPEGCRAVLIENANNKKDALKLADILRKKYR